MKRNTSQTRRKWKHSPVQPSEMMQGLWEYPLCPLRRLSCYSDELTGPLEVGCCDVWVCRKSVKHMIIVHCCNNRFDRGQVTRELEANQRSFVIEH
jgi:hypothetical protein